MVHFPQIKGLGSSAMSKTYSISSLEGATAYLNHHVLAPRLFECARLVTDTSDRTIKQILGPTDCEKFRSSMTLFARATAENQVFEDALHKYLAHVRLTNSLSRYYVRPEISPIHK